MPLAMDFFPININFKDIDSFYDIVPTVLILAIIYMVLRIIQDWNKARLEKSLSKKIRQDFEAMTHNGFEELAKFNVNLNMLLHRIDEISKDRSLLRAYILREFETTSKSTTYEMCIQLCEVIFDYIASRNYIFVYDVLQHNRVDENRKYVEKKICEETESYISYFRDNIIGLTILGEIEVITIINTHILKELYRQIVDMNKSIIFEYTIKPEQAREHINRAMSGIKMNFIKEIEEDYNKIKAEIYGKN